ncbi:hypothetical protein F5Y12DRAFT_775505 [Xylaria sp. FL1777]|nr:hypothetical protein F5Y12DRAFT_775505 [Xylaria sp. FL1777]
MTGDVQRSVTTCSLETLPLLILEEICEYVALERSDNGKDEGRSIWAFSLVCRNCCYASAAQRFRTIRLEFSNHLLLRDILNRWDEILTAGNHFRHVRQLILVHTDDSTKPGQVHRIDGQGSFDMDDSLKPAGVTISKHWFATTWSGHQKDAEKTWQAVARLISRTAGLKDFVYALRDHLNPCILAAIHDVGCRLHMHYFSLPSLYQPRYKPSDINADDYALATSPCLHAIVVSHSQYDIDGLVDYHKEATLRMVAGVAPNLAHVWLRSKPVGGTVIAFRRAMSSDRPPWRGFFPSKDREDDVLSMGSLKSLILDDNRVGRDDLLSWGRTTDLSRLESLAVSFKSYGYTSYTTSCKGLETLVELAIAGQFASLRSLSLEYNGKNEYYSKVHTAFTVFLNNIGPLDRLHVPQLNAMRTEALSAAVSRHVLCPCCEVGFSTVGSYK